MALTSEEVVEHGGQVVEQVNRLAEQMNVFQQRLDGLGGTYDEMSQHMDQREDEIRQAFDNLGEIIKGEAKTQIQSAGNTLEEALKAPTIEGIKTLKDNLGSEFNKVTSSSQEVVESWRQWADTEIAQLLADIKDDATQRTADLNAVIEAANEDVELMETTANTYIESSSNLLSEIEENLGESIGLLSEEQENYGVAMLDSYASKLEETLKEARELLTDTQGKTEEVFNQEMEDFSDIVNSKLIPIIDDLVETVTGAIDEMMEDIINIGDNADGKTQSLDLVTEALEGLIEPIKEIIDRTQGVKDTVGAFL